MRWYGGMEAAAVRRGPARLGNSVTPGMATASDSCSGPTITAADASVSGTCFSETITRTWAAVDDCFNTNICTQVITVVGPAEAIDQLIADVLELDLHAGTENSLIVKLQNAQARVEDGNATSPVNQLGAFINEAQAQSGKKITVAEVNELVAIAEAIIAAVQAGGACP